MVIKYDRAQVGRDLKFHYKFMQPIIGSRIVLLVPMYLHIDKASVLFL